MQLELNGFTLATRSLYRASAELSRSELEHFHAFGTPTIVGDLTVDSRETIAVFMNEFWTLKLEDFAIPAAKQAGLKPILVIVNQQEFTKTSNCWGVSNMSKGTNTNRVVLLQKQ